MTSLTKGPSILHHSLPRSNKDPGRCSLTQEAAILSSSCQNAVDFPNQLYPQSDYYNMMMMESGPIHRQPGVPINGYFELNDSGNDSDLCGQKSVELLENCYGGRLRVQRAARIIQSAYRDYKLRAEYTRIRLGNRTNHRTIKEAGNGNLFLPHAPNFDSGDYETRCNFQPKSIEPSVSLEDLVLEQAYVDWALKAAAEQAGCGISCNSDSTGGPQSSDQNSEVGSANVTTNENVVREFVTSSSKHNDLLVQPMKELIIDKIPCIAAQNPQIYSTDLNLKSQDASTSQQRQNITYAPIIKVNRETNGQTVSISPQQTLCNCPMGELPNTAWDLHRQKNNPTHYVPVSGHGHTTNGGVIPTIGILRSGTVALGNCSCTTTTIGQSKGQRLLYVRTGQKHSPSSHTQSQCQCLGPEDYVPSNFCDKTVNQDYPRKSKLFLVDSVTACKLAASRSIPCNTVVGRFAQTTAAVHSQQQRQVFKSTAQSTGTKAPISLACCNNVARNGHVVDPLVLAAVPLVQHRHPSYSTSSSANRTHARHASLPPHHLVSIPTVVKHQHRQQNQASGNRFLIPTVQSSCPIHASSVPWHAVGPNSTPVCCSPPAAVSPAVLQSHALLPQHYYQQYSGGSASSAPNATTTTTTILSKQMCAIERRRKRVYRIGLNIFNRSPPKGIEFLIRCGFLSGTPETTARFLLTRKGLSRVAIGDYLGNTKDPLALNVTRQFMRELDFRGKEVDEALRMLFSCFRTPGESQKIVHLLTEFQSAYVEQNSAQVSARFRSLDSVMVLAYAIVMLHTDMYSPSVRAQVKMTREEFVRNLRGVDAGEDLDREMLLAIYERIQQQEMSVLPDHTDQVRKIQQHLTGPNRPLNLSAPQRRLVCYCRLYEVMDRNKRERTGAHQREVFLFNDILIITKAVQKKRRDATLAYQVRLVICLLGVHLVTFDTQHHPHGIELWLPANRHSKYTDNSNGSNSTSEDGSQPRLLITFNTKTPSDRARFVEDLQECILELGEMERFQLDENLSKRAQQNGKKQLPASNTSKSDCKGSAEGHCAQRVQGVVDSRPPQCQCPANSPDVTTTTTTSSSAGQQVKQRVPFHCLPYGVDSRHMSNGTQQQQRLSGDSGLSADLVDTPTSQTSKVFGCSSSSISS